MKTFTINFAVSSRVDNFVPFSVRLQASDDEDAKNRLRALVDSRYEIVDFEIV